MSPLPPLYLSGETLGGFFHFFLLVRMEKIRQFLNETSNNGEDRIEESGVKHVYFFVKPNDHFNLKRFEFLSKFYSFFSIPNNIITDNSNLANTILNDDILIFDYKRISPSTLLYCCSSVDTKSEFEEYSNSCCSFLVQFEREESGSNIDLLFNSCLLFDLFDKKMINWNKRISFLTNSSSTNNSSTHSAIYCQYTMARIEGIVRNSPQLISLYKELQTNNQSDEWISVILPGENVTNLKQMSIIIKSIEQCELLLMTCIKKPQNLAKFINQFNSTCHFITNYLSFARVKTPLSNSNRESGIGSTINDLRGLFLMAVLKRVSKFWQVFGLFHPKFM